MSSRGAGARCSTALTCRSWTPVSATSECAALSLLRSPPTSSSFEQVSPGVSQAFLDHQPSCPDRTLEAGRQRSSPLSLRAACSTRTGRATRTQASHQVAVCHCRPLLLGRARRRLDARAHAPQVDSAFLFRTPAHFSTRSATNEDGARLLDSWLIARAIAACRRRCCSALLSPDASARPHCRARSRSSRSSQKPDPFEPPTFRTR